MNKKFKIFLCILICILGIYTIKECRGLEENDNFYQKLSSGRKVEILIVGDSISAPMEDIAWTMLLKDYLQKEYGAKVNITNLSMGGTSSYSGYARINMLRSKKKYDLAIICYGQNDSETNFSLYYESIYRALQNRYPTCSLISILESAQQGYTKKINDIIRLADYYRVPIVDTIGAFQKSGFSNEQLTEDGVHLNEKGHNIYFEEIKNTIEEELDFYDSNRKPLNDKVENYSSTKVLLEKEFKRINDTSYEIKIDSLNGEIGIWYGYQPGKNKVTIISGEEIIDEVEFEWNYTFQQEQILLIPKIYNFNDNIRIVFGTKEQADSFHGVCISFSDK